MGGSSTLHRVPAPSLAGLGTGLPQSLQVVVAAEVPRPLRWAGRGGAGRGQGRDRSETLELGLSPCWSQSPMDDMWGPTLTALPAPCQPAFWVWNRNPKTRQPLLFWQLANNSALHCPIGVR